MPSHNKKLGQRKRKKLSQKQQRKKFVKDHISQRKTSWKPINTKVPGLKHRTAVKPLKCRKLWTYSGERFVLTKEPLAFSVHKKGNPAAQEMGPAQHLMVAVKDENTGKYRPLHYMDVVWKNSVGKYECCGASFVSDDSSGIMSLGSINTPPLEIRDSKSNNKKEWLLEWLNQALGPNICTRHALGKAICDASMMIPDFDLLQVKVVQALANLYGNDHRGGWPDRFDKTTVKLKDAKTKQEIEVTINVKSVSKDELIKEMNSNKPARYVLVKTESNGESHCFYIKKFNKDSSTLTLYINSDRDNADPVEKIDRPGNTFYSLGLDIREAFFSTV